MKVAQYLYVPDTGWRSLTAPEDGVAPDCLLAFGSGTDCNGDILLQWRNQHFPGVPLLGCSTAGEIVDTEILNNSIVVTGIEFDDVKVEIEQAVLRAFSDSSQNSPSFQVGKYLGGKFERTKLKLLLVLSDGTQVNGSELVDGLKAGVGKDVPITGGLAGDGKRFSETQVIVNERYGAGFVGALGFYGDQLEVGYGSLGGWDTFGPDRLVTRAEGNVLYELDHRNALALYKDYLGEYANELPASGLLFPLSMSDGKDGRIVRTLLGIDEAKQSMTFAGDLPEGTLVRMMRANFERLIEGAYGAARRCIKPGAPPVDLAILISCVGRRLVLAQRAEEELEEVRDVLGTHPKMTGFYSYGEISPLSGALDCALHNQTMTITTLREANDS